ncbi:hypothetical protein IKG50_01460 [Candidatus Saccharibacteria bacterium]|nr:hypothetical protein [Candidatus Saccharibacteria bacterium]
MGSLFKQQISGRRDETKIILSPEIYNRLFSFMCLSSYFSYFRGEYEEFGQFIFGKKVKDGLFFYDQTTHPGNTESAGAYHCTNEDVEDTITKLMTGKYDCIASFHTHPADSESGRCFSWEDTEFYIHKTDIKKGCLFLGCMISQPVIGDWSDDEISFIRYDKKDQSFIYYPDIYVAQGAKLIPLKKQTDLMYIGKDNKPYNKITLKDNVEIDRVYTIERTTMSI